MATKLQTAFSDAMFAENFCFCDWNFTEVHPQVSIDYKSALIQVLILVLSANKSLLEPMVIKITEAKHPLQHKELTDILMCYVHFITNYIHHYGKM